MSFSVSRNRSFSSLSFAMCPSGVVVSLEPVASQVVPRRLSRQNEKGRSMRERAGTIFHPRNAGCGSGTSTKRYMGRAASYLIKTGVVVSTKLGVHFVTQVHRF